MGEQPSYEGLKVTEAEPGFYYEWVHPEGWVEPEQVEICWFRQWLGDRLLDWAMRIDPGIMF